MFSSRLPGGVPPNAITRAVQTLRDRGVPVIDLTETNPTKVGLAYPDDVTTVLGDARGRTYEPDALGGRTAREAVARESARSSAPRHPGTTDPARIVLTTSTSEAYALLFKLLCDAGDEVLVPQPGYPLFDMLAGLENVRPVPYRLECHGRWSIDRNTVEQALTNRTRALIVVTPNNPTGSMLRADDRDWLGKLCAARDIAIISDEVFADYPLRPAADASSLSGESRALTFVLGGLSKSAGLPQIKLGWIIVNGPEPQVAGALDRLELICDTYLSVSTAAQIAASALIDAGAKIRAAIQERLETNLSALELLLRGDSAISLMTPEGGWSAVLRVPATESEDTTVVRLLNDARVLVHPGFFFDFHSEAFLVVSLLPEPDTFSEGIRRLASAIEGVRPA